MSPIVLALLLTAANPSFEAQTLDGQTFVGALTALNDDRLTIQTTNGPLSLDIENIVDLSGRQSLLSRASANGVCLQLVDGSLVRGQQFACREGRSMLTLYNGKSLDMPIRDVLSVRLQWEPESLSAEWTRLASAKRDTDLLVLRKDDALDYHEGVLHDVTEDMVQFDVDGEVLPVKRAKIYGLAYHHRIEDAGSPARCRVSDVWGSQWSARTIALTDAFRWTTSTGLEMSLPVERVTKIDFSLGKIAYLSDLEPESVRWSPFFGSDRVPQVMEEFYAPRRDCNFNSDPLQLGGTPYAKGLAVHSRTELTYRVPSGFSRFRAVAGIDEAVRPNGKVRVVVRADAKILLDTVVAGADPPRPIDLDLTGARRLVILVDFVGAANAGDHLLLCNARITK